MSKSNRTAETANPIICVDPGLRKKVTNEPIMPTPVALPYFPRNHTVTRSGKYDATSQNIGSLNNVKPKGPIVKFKAAQSPLNIPIKAIYFVLLIDILLFGKKVILYKLLTKNLIVQRKYSNTGLNDIKDAYMKLVNEYVNMIKEILSQNLISVCLFGSIARGDFTQESDIDILIVAKNLPEDVGRRHSLLTEARLKILLSDIAENLRKLGYSITFSEVILTPDEIRRHPPILLDIVEDGIIFYDDNNFLLSVINDVRKRLKELGAKKIRLEHGWYWLLKHDAKFGEEIVI